MPVINGRVYTEPDGWTMPSPEFRLLVPPGAVTSAGSHLLDIDALSVFLRSLPGPPCGLRLFSYGAEAIVPERFAGLSIPFTRLTAEPLRESIERVRAAFGEHAAPQDTVDLLARGIEAKVDIVVPEVVPTDPPQIELMKALDIEVCDWREATRACEVFVRGHEVPWAFNTAFWGLPWSHLYLWAERAERLWALREAIHVRIASPETCELARSLAFNRHPSLAYTRDRLLFYVQQRRTARRFGFRRSDFVFECNYYLNHYYLLLWGGLEQMCLIMNDVCGIGLPRKRVGIASPDFLKALTGRPAHAILNDPEFVRWRKVLSSARHLAAHQGITMASPMFEATEQEPSVAELDAAIEASDEWRSNVAMFGAAGAEEFRELFRVEGRLGRMTEFPERVLPIEIDGQRGFIMPLLNVQWDFDQFMAFANRVANALIEHLEGVGASAASERGE